MLWFGSESIQHIIQWFWKGFSKMHVGLSFWKCWSPDLKQKQAIFMTFTLWILPIPNSVCQIEYSALIWLLPMLLCLTVDHLTEAVTKGQISKLRPGSEFHFTDSGTTGYRCLKPVVNFSFKGLNSPSQVTCPVNILRKPQSVRHMQKEASQPVHVGAWVSHLYLHRASIRCFRRVAVFISLACLWSLY